MFQWGGNCKPASCWAWLCSAFGEEKAVWEKKETLSEDDKEKQAVHELLEKKILNRKKRPKAILPENLKKTDKNQRKQSFPKTLQREWKSEWSKECPKEFEEGTEKQEAKISKNLRAKKAEEEKTKTVRGEEEREKGEEEEEEKAGKSQAEKNWRLSTWEADSKGEDGNVQGEFQEGQGESGAV